MDEKYCTRMSEHREYTWVLTLELFRIASDTSVTYFQGRATILLNLGYC